MFRWALLGLLTLAHGEESLEELEAEKPQLLKVVEAAKRPKDGLELRVLQRHGRAPLPPEPKHLPSSEDELMQEFDEVIVEWKTNFYVSSISIRLPEKQQQLPHAVNYDGYEFFTTRDGECKFQLGDKSVLPGNDTQPARDLAGSGEISNCVADNSDVDPGELKPRRSSALLKFHPHPFEHNASGWRYFSMMIRNAQKTPVRSSINGQEANTFQIVVDTPWERVAEMSFEGLEIKAVWVCSYTPWVVTTPCTTDCGGGFRTRVRRKLHANPEGYDPKLLKDCDENIEEHESCNPQTCDVDCQLSEWTPWANGACSRSCGNGTMVERRNVVMGPKGNGKICPPWSSEARVRTVPCNPTPCPASCSDSPLLGQYLGILNDSSSDLLIFKKLPQPGIKAVQDPIEDEDTQDTQSSLEDSENTEMNEDTNVTNVTSEASSAASDEDDSSEKVQQQASNELDQQPNDQVTNEDEDEDSSKVDDSADGAQSLLSEREIIWTQMGLSKSSCSEPCGGGRRLVVLPSEQKVSSANEEKTCYRAFEEDCNVFECQPLLFQPASPWQLPLLGKWFMVEVEFVIEELTESLALRAPPDFQLAATSGDASECFLVEHSLPNLENCTVYPGQTSDNTGPIFMLDFSNALEPQSSYNTKQNWHYMRFWVQHPEHCSGGTTDDGRCLGLVGEREWTLSVKLTEPNALWELVKGSYEFFVDETSARAAFVANAAKNRPLTDEAQEIQPTESRTPEESKETAKGDRESGGKDSLIQEHELRHRGHHRGRQVKQRWSQ